MATTYTEHGPLTAAGFTTDASGVAWVITDAVAGQPAPSPIASVRIHEGQASAVLSSAASGLGFSVPAGRRITGIRVKAKARLRSSDNPILDSWLLYVTIKKGGSIIGSGSLSFMNIVTPPAGGAYDLYTYGSNVQDLGLTSAQAADPTTVNGTFTVTIQADATFGDTGTATIEIDSIEVSVFTVALTQPFYACSDPAIGSDGYTRGQALDPATPWKTIGKFTSTRVNGDKLEIWSGTDLATGLFRESVNVTGDTAGGSIVQRAGSTKARLVGDTVVTGSWSGSGGVFTTNIGTGKTLQTVTYDWHTSIDAKGRHYGHLKAGAATVGTNTYSYNSGTGVLTIGIGAGESPTGHVVSYTATNQPGINLVNCAGFKLSGFEVSLFCAVGAGNGYGVLGQNCTGCDISVDCYDNGYHAIGFVGNTDQNNYMHDCVVSGGTDQGTCVVFYSDLNPVSGCIGARLTLLRHTKLGRDGDLLTPAESFGGAFSHSNVKANVTGVLWIDCNEIGMGKASDGSGNPGTPFGTNDTGQPSDPTDPNTYGVRCIRCTWTGDSGGQGFTSIAFVNCTMDFSRAGKVGAQQVMGGNGTATAANTPVYYGCFGCVIKWDGESASGGDTVSLFLVENSSNSSKFILHNCSVYEYGSLAGANNKVMFFWNGALAGGNVDAKGCIFGFRNAAGFNWLNLNDPTYAAGKHVFADNVYWQVIGSRWSQNPSFDTQAEWASAIDTNGIFRGSNAFASADGSDMQPATDLKAIKKQLNLKVPVGINGLPNDGTYGAYQYGGAAGGSAGASGFSTRIGIGI